MSGTFDWKHASKASICAFMLAFAPLGTVMAQSSDDGYVAPAEPASADSDDTSDVAAPAAPAAAAPAGAAPAGAASAEAATGPTTELGTVSVTGTAISSADKATSLPVTTYDASDLREQGVTSTPQLMQRIVGNSTDAGPGLSTGTSNTGGYSFANLRGLGSDKTLILLNGRRLAVNALNGGAVDLNTIPFAAIQRVEVLRDGASALYGTDAIGGVINFITKKNLDGGNVDLNYSVPTRDGGGNGTTISATFGKGDFEKDGWNVMGTLSYQRQGAINANDRDFITPLDPRINSVSSFTNPAQYLQSSTGVFVNPTAANGCDNVFGQVNNDGETCYENFTVLGGAEVVQQYDKPSFFGQGSYKINDNNQVSLSYLWTRKTTRALAAPSPASGYPEIQPGTPFYPGNGIVPGPTAAQGAANFDPSEPVTAYYRSVPLGARQSEGVNEYHRVVLDFDGKLPWNVNYDTSFAYNQASTDINLIHGYYNQSATITDANGNQVIDPNSLQAKINAGQYNPFTTNLTQAQRQALQSSETHGTIEADKTRAYVWNGKIDRRIGDWFGAGASALALGAQYRHETLTATTDGYLGDRAPSSGFSASSVDEDRDVEGVFGELNVPLPFNVELDAQARYDNYSDVGDTINPKVSLRYQPFQQLTLRASYGEGFHAPTLYDLYEPNHLTFTPGALDDPELCPGGNPTGNAVSTRDCNTQFQQNTGGNADLQPEKSKQWTIGFVAQPMKYTSLSVDFYAVELSQQISTLDPSYVFDNYGTYSDRFNRDPDTNAIDSFNNTNSNLGKTITNGETVQLNVAVPTDYGTFSLDVQGNYINKYEYQTAQDSDYIDNVSFYSNGNIFRWKHNVTLGWAKGPMALGVINHYMSGYKDADSSPSHPHVHDYVTWDTYGSYSFDNGLQLTLGSNNVFDADPPFSVQTDAGNSGYDARYAEGIGRTVYGRLSYSF
ncbi:TonB-dependent receptor [Salinisphaera sp. SPP-AMP-43]|uniref:TonB-dependent receptor n=1 Tax=Salinisphaera sp. SPP-AMP-43 TaxID=3121288 RepID=UPI003C6E99F2